MSGPETTTLKTAIVGCGNMAKVHVRLLSKLSDKSRIALCDTDERRLQDFADETGIRSTFQDLDECLDTFGPQIVHIVTPPGSHKHLAIKCLDHGCHVLLEKPLCVTSQEADDIQAAAERNDRLVCVDHMRSYDPLLFKAKTLLDSGYIGDLTNVSIHYSYDYLKRIDSDPAARWINNLPGGSFFDLLPHVLCFLDAFCPDWKLTHHLVKKSKDDLVTDAHCLFTSPQSTASLHMSLNVWPLKNYVECEGTKGTVRIDFRNFLMIKRPLFRLPNAIERIAGNLWVGTQYLLGSLASVFNFVRGRLDPYAGLGEIMRQFYRNVETGVKVSPVPATTAKRFLEVAEAVFEERPTPDSQPAAPVEGPLRDSDVLVTGGTGFIGRPLVEALVAKGHSVRVLTHRELTRDEKDKWLDTGVDLVHGQIYSLEDVQRAMRGVKTVYHLAAAMQGDWNYHLDTTVTGTANILEAAEQEGIQHLIHMSTLNVYEAIRYPNGETIDEHFPLEQFPQKRGSYSRAKKMAEDLIREALESAKFSVTVFRPGLVYGGDNKTIPQDVGIALGSSVLCVLGWGNRQLPLVYVDHVVDALVLAGESKDSSCGQVFNVIDPDYPTQRKYIKTYRAITHKPVRPIYVPMPVVKAGFWMIERLLKLKNPAKAPSLLYKLGCISSNPRHSTKRAEEALGWKPAHSFESNLETMFGETESENAHP